MTRDHLWWIALVTGVLACVTSGALAQAGPQLDLPKVQVRAGMYLIQAQVASTPRQREIGLMYRTDLPSSEGMLFVFERPEVQCFWMKNTPLALSIAFIAEDGRIVNLSEMTPMSEQSHCSREPVRFVLEMNQAWFSKKRIEPGFILISSIFKK